MTDEAPPVDPGTPAMSLDQLAEVLVRLGCPSDRCEAMAAQLQRRAEQLAGKTGRTQTEALQHLLLLMRQGWSAKAKGL